MGRDDTFTLAERFLATLREIAPSTVAGAPIVIGVSGGPDSMALLHLAMRAGLGVLHAVHVNYKLRGEASDKDQELVESFCRENGIAVHVFEHDPSRDRGDAGTGNLQDWARMVRYDRFRGVAEEVAYKSAGAGDVAAAGEAPGSDIATSEASKTAAGMKRPVVMTAHHRDDQLETILLKMMRGAGMGQWRGMEPVGPMPWSSDAMHQNPSKAPGPHPLPPLLVRPLLEVSREELMAYIGEHGIPYRIDASNESTGYARNFLRHHWRPALDRLTPGWEGHLLSLRDRAEEFRLLTELTLQRCTIPEAATEVAATEAETGAVGPTRSALLRPEWLSLPSAIQHVILAQWFREHGAAFSQAALESVAASMIGLQTGRAVTLNPRTRIQRDRDRFILEQEIPPSVTAASVTSDRSSATSAAAASVTSDRPTATALDAPSTAATGSSGTVPVVFRVNDIGDMFVVEPIRVLPIRIERRPWNGQITHLSGALILNAVALHQADLVMRAWEPGDRIQPLGMGGRHQLVSDLLTNRKIPSTLRSRCLVLEVRPDDGTMPWIAAVSHPSDAKAQPGAISERVRCDDSSVDCMTIRLLSGE